MNQVIEKILNDVARKYGQVCWHDILIDFKAGEITLLDFEIMEAEAMHRLAENCCKEQITTCHKAWLEAERNDEAEETAIIESALASDKYKP